VETEKEGKNERDLYAHCPTGDHTINETALSGFHLTHALWSIWALTKRAACCVLPTIRMRRSHIRGGGCCLLEATAHGGSCLRCHELGVDVDRVVGYVCMYKMIMGPERRGLAGFGLFAEHVRSRNEDCLADLMRSFAEQSRHSRLRWVRQSRWW
jgi:hypothetical protein